MKKLLSLLIALILFVTAFTTVFAVDALDNDKEIKAISSDYQTESNVTKTVNTPKALQERFPDFNFSLVKLGDVGVYELYYNVTDYYTFMDYDVVLGDYVFDCFARQTPYDLGLYVVTDSSAYTLKEGYDEGLVNIESVVSLINAQDSIRYNFKIKKAEKTPYEIFSEYMKSVSKLSGIEELGKTKYGTLFYGVTGMCAAITVYTEIGDYVIYCSMRDTNNPTCLYIVKDNAVYRLKDAYNKGFVNMDEVYNLVNAYDGRFDHTLTIQKTNTVKKSPKLSETKVNIKSGQSKSIKITNGTVKSWSSSNKKVVSVSKGKITALNKGAATITATLTTGKKLTCKVNVKTAPKLKKNTVKVKKGSIVKVKLSGKAASIKNKYTNTKYAKILSKSSATTLKIRGLKKGTSTLKIKVNNVKTLSLKVTVK